MKIDRIEGKEPRVELPGTNWRWLLAAAVLFMLVLVPVLLLATHWPFTREKIASSIQKQFPGPVEIKGYRNVYFPHPGFVAEDITVQGISLDPKHPMITAHRFALQGGYTTILTSVKHFQAHLEGLHLAVPADYHFDRPKTSDDTNAKQILDQLQVNSSVVEFDRDDHAPLLFNVHHLTAGPLSADKPAAFQISLTNPLPPGKVNIEGHFGPWQGRKVAESALSGSYTFDKADLGVFSAVAGILSSAGTFRGVLNQLAVEGWTRTPNFEIRKSGNPINLEGKFRVDVNGTNGDVYLRDTAFSWGRTTLLGVGEITGRPNQKGKTVDVKMTVHHGRIQDLMLLAMHSSPTMDGPTSFRGHAILPPGKEKFIKRIQFSADFGIDDAEFTRPNAQKGVDTLSERARGAKDSDLERVLSDLKGNVILSEGIAHLTNATLTVPAAAAQFHGTANMVTKELDLHGQLRMAATLSQATTGFKSILLKVVDPFFMDKKHHAGSDIPVKMTGTFSQPRFGVELFR